ncbi:MAG: Asp-tRNA(Asn)/Glu-tRNA(Gln) amidotransferase subunit GatC [Gammaproteobacteria bacterium]|nr:Asp-tRNA(Asn)/Glu-tRNA(Gln) amidotransferase subunit GatC [Gammaproteobacteria bacterium]
MALTASDVKKIARLARLAVVEQDIPAYARNLSNIMGLVEQMNAVDTREATPMAHPLELPARLRPDQITETIQRELFQSIAPRVEAGLYLVPKVIE